MEEELVPRAGLRLETILGGAIVGVSPHIMIKNAAKLTWSLGKASGIVRGFKPHVTFLTGGYVAPPVALAARLQGVPVAIYLPDVEPGRAINAVMRLAQRVGCTTEGSRAYVPGEKMVVTGYPVRPELRAAAGLSRREALAQFDLRPERPTLFVFGGSRGAWSINKALMAILPRLLETVQVIHISGKLTWPYVEAGAQTLTAEQRRYYRPYAYLHERMGSAYRAADLVVARAGASMLGESPAFGVPTILVPYPHAWRYQKVNADYLAARGAALRLEDERLAEELLPAVMGLLQDKAKLTQMGEAAKALDVPDAAVNLARLIINLGQGETA